MISFDTADDAGIYKLDSNTALVQTLDFFTPIVDDPKWFGAIAAANSLSDVYAMGGRPLTALNILCFPIDTRPKQELTDILYAGALKIKESGAMLLGGHSLEDSEPKYGLSVTGIIDPAHVASNSGAQPGDKIVLTKPLGTGIITTAAKYGECPDYVLDEACRRMAELNGSASEAMRIIGIGADYPVHAATDITGYGLLGHLFQVARASKAGIKLNSLAMPVLPEAEMLAALGYITRGDKANRDYLGECLEQGIDVSPTRMNLMLDPQTSGGLAIFVAERYLDSLMNQLSILGVETFELIGEVIAADRPRMIVV